MLLTGYGRGMKRNDLNSFDSCGENLSIASASAAFLSAACSAEATAANRAKLTITCNSNVT